MVVRPCRGPFPKPGDEVDQAFGGALMTDILIVEDEPAILESLEFILTRCGWKVGVARDGEAALEAAYKYRPRMVLLDIMLPKKGGFDVLKTLRSDEVFGSIAVLILTARGQQYDRKAAMDLKADGFITKPFANDEVVSAVRELLEGDGRLAAHA
ncbi:MAG: response regulator [Burkholderiaceae bacterium]